MIKYLFIFALVIIGCTHAEQVCPDLALAMFPSETSMQGIKIESSDSLVILCKGDTSTDIMNVSAYICRYDFGGWQISPVGILHIDKKPAERK